MEQFWWLLLIQVLVSENNFKKESGEITFVLIGSFHVQIKEPASKSTTTRLFVFLAKFAEFPYYKIFKTISQ